jgi:hypothetical protein
VQADGNLPAVAAGRIRVIRSDERVVLAIGALTGIAMAWQGLQPTGAAVLDWVLLVLACTAAVWAAVTAPWWSLVVLAAFAAALAPPPAGLVIGLGVVALALLVGAMRRGQAVDRALIAAGALLLLAVAREVVAWGVNAVVSVVVVLVVGVLGVLRRPDRERRLAWAVLGGAAVVAAVGAAGLAWAGLSARSELSTGHAKARQALALMKRGEFDAARESFGQAAVRFEDAADAIRAPWAQPARLVPVAAQHRSSGALLSTAAAQAARTIEAQLRLVDLDALRLVDGRIDVAAVRALQEPIAELQTALDVLEADVHAAESGWLASPIGDELAELAAEIDEQQRFGDTLGDALVVAPAMLGADGPRTYFVMFTTPAEARGQGGFMGNWAELAVTDGRIELTRFGRHSDLNDAGSRPRRLTTVPADWLARYGHFGFAKQPGGVVGEQPWHLNTLSPNFPSAAQLVADLYPQSGGRPVDGVFSVDVFAMEALVGTVGPIKVDRAPTLNGRNTAEFLLLGQYAALDDDFRRADRVDMLETIAHETITRLLTSDPPDPLKLGRAIGPLIRESRVYGWSPVAEEQALLTAIDMDGTVLDDDLLVDTRGTRRDGVLVSVNNAAGNKIDSFLERSFEYDSTTGELRLTFTNTAPAEGYPPVVIGSAAGELPMGTNLLWLSVFTTAPFDWAIVDGTRVPVTASTEAGKLVYDRTISLGPGEAETVVFHYDGVAGYPTALVQQVQPLGRTAETAGFVP